MAEEYVGSIVLYLDGQEIEIIDLNVSTKTGRKLIKTMNRTGKPKGFSKGVKEHELSITAVIPLTGDLAWDDIVGAKITLFPLDASGSKTTYRGCATLEVGEKYSVEDEARRDIKMQALDKVIE